MNAVRTQFTIYECLYLSLNKLSIYSDYLYCLYVSGKLVENLVRLQTKTTFCLMIWITLSFFASLLTFLIEEMWIFLKIFSNLSPFGAYFNEFKKLCLKAFHVTVISLHPSFTILTRYHALLVVIVYSTSCILKVYAISHWSCSWW